MIKGKKEDLDDIIKRFQCPEHGAILGVAWLALENSYVIRCGENHFPEEVQPLPSLTAMYKQGTELPEPIKSRVKKSIEKRAARLPPAPGAEPFTGVPSTDLGTGELLKHEMVLALVAYAEKYGLDPARGHVCLMYGKPYITLDGYLYHAWQTGTHYTLASRPLSKEEILTFQIPEGAHAWQAKVRFLDTENTFTGLGIVTHDELTAKSSRDINKLRLPVVAAHPWLLAQKRAEWQALRRAFPIGESVADNV